MTTGIEGHRGKAKNFNGGKFEHQPRSIVSHVRQVLVSSKYHSYTFSISSTHFAPKVDIELHTGKIIIKTGSSYDMNY